MLGTTALNGPLLTDLRGRIADLSADKRGLEGEVGELRADLTAADEFAAAVGPGLVAGSLDAQRVLLVVTPDTPAALPERLTPLLGRAGAQVAGTLRVLPALSDPGSEQLVEDLVAEVLPPGVDLPGGEPAARATAELAAVLGRRPGAKGVEAADAQAVLSAFQEADLVQYAGQGPSLQPATAVVVLSGPAVETEPDEKALAAQQALLSLAGAFDDTTGGVVLAGPSGSGAENGLVRVLREDSGAAGRVSSVDNADRGTGLVATVRALSEQLRGRVGAYGAGEGVAGALPSAAP